MNELNQNLAENINNLLSGLKDEVILGLQQYMNLGTALLRE